MNENPKAFSPKDALIQLTLASDWIASFEPSYPELFKSFRAKGWLPKKYSQQPSGYAGAAGRFVYNSKALEMELEFGGMLLPTVGTERSREFQFSAEQIFDSLEYSDDQYERHVQDLLPGDPFPVGEVGGSFRGILFVADTGKAAMFSDMLDSCWLADDPFKLLDSVLFERNHPSIREVVAPPSRLVTGEFRHRPLRPKRTDITQKQLEAASDWIASFEPIYPHLFNSFRAQGWSPGQYSQQSTGYASEASRFVRNSHAMQIELEFGGLSFPESLSDFRFAAGTTFEDFTLSAHDYHDEVFDLLPGDPFPVGEVGGGLRTVLFVAETGKAIMITDILNAYWLADDPFILLDSMLFGRDFNPKIRDMVVAQGDRVSGRPKEPSHFAV